MNDNKLEERLCENLIQLERGEEVMKQLEDVNDQTVYMQQFNAALGSALNEVKTLRSKIAREKSKGFEFLLEKQRPNQLRQTFPEVNSKQLAPSIKIETLDAVLKGE